MIDRIFYLQRSSIPVFTPSTPTNVERISFPPTILTDFYRNFDRNSQWISNLEEQIDREEPIALNDLKQVKEQFQKHEVTKSMNVCQCRFVSLGIYG